MYRRATFALPNRLSRLSARAARTDQGARVTIDAINVHVVAGTLYKALKEIRKLMKREAELIAA